MKNETDAGQDNFYSVSWVNAWLESFDFEKLDPAGQNKKPKLLEPREYAKLRKGIVKQSKECIQKYNQYGNNDP